MCCAAVNYLLSSLFKVHSLNIVIDNVFELSIVNLYMSAGFSGLWKLNSVNWNMELVNVNPILSRSFNLS